MTRAAALLLVTLGLAPSLAAHPGLDERLARAAAAIADEPRDPRPLLARAALHVEHGELALAEADLTAAARLAPGLPDVDLARAEARLASGAPREAATVLDALLARQDLADAARRRALGLRASALEGTGRLAAAMEDLRAAMGPGPRRGSIPEWTRLAALAGRAGGAEAELAVLDEALTVHGGAVVLEARALELELSLGRADAAAERARRLRDADAGSPLAVLALARALVVAGRPLEAREELCALAGSPGILARRPALRAELDAALAALEGTSP